MHFKILLTLLFVGSLVASAQTEPAENLISNGDFSAGVNDWIITKKAYCPFSVKDQKVGEYSHILSLQPSLAVEGKPHWIRIMQTLQKYLKKGTPLSGKIWLRSPESLKVSARIGPGEKTLHREMVLTPEWKEYEFKGKCEQDYDEDQYEFAVDLAYGEGTIEMTGVRLFAAATIPTTEKK